MSSIGQWIQNRMSPFFALLVVVALCATFQKDLLFEYYQEFRSDRKTTAI